MPVATYHVRKVSLGLKRKYRIFDDDGKGRPGAVIGYADKQLTVAEQVTLYRDEQRRDPWVVVRESDRGWLAALTGYQALDGDGDVLGSFGVLWRKSIDRTTWEFDQPGLGRFTGTERRASTARARRLLGLADVAGEIVGSMVKYHFDFELDGAPMFSVEKPKFLDDWYRLVVHDDRIDRDLLLALGVTMEARQRG